jgi:hypothetical protein
MDILLRGHEFLPVNECRQRFLECCDLVPVLFIGGVSSWYDVDGMLATRRKLVQSIKSFL